jgi:hypothetical protein
LQALAAAPLSTRDLRSWFAHYQEASRVTRERLIDHPQLFVQARQESDEQHFNERLRYGPEGECETDLQRVNVIIARVSKRLPRICPLPEAAVDGPSLVCRTASRLFATTSSAMPSIIPTEIRNSVRVLKAQGRTLPEISRALKLSRNTVRCILRNAEAAPVPSCEPLMLARLGDAFARAGGNVARVQQLIAAENDVQVPYSTLTRWVREAGLRRPPPRAGEYCFAPGAEMQHDTSPHRLTMAGKPITAQCAALVWRSRAGCLFNIIPASPALRPSTSCSRRRASWTAPARSASSTTPASWSPPVQVRRQ